MIKVDVVILRLTGGLHKEGQDISRHEDLGHPFDADHTVLFCAKDDDHSAKFHVDARCEQGWCHQSQDGLYDVRAKCPVGRLITGHGTCDISYPFDCV